MRQQVSRVVLRGALASGLVATMLALAGSAPSVAATTGSLTLSATSGSAGTRILLTGTGFVPGELVQPYWDYGTATAITMKSFYLYNPIVTADPSGTARTDTFLPVKPGGPHSLSLVGQTSGTVDTAAILLVPRLDAGSVIAPAGTTLQFTGWDLGNKDPFTVSFNGTPVASGTTDLKGFFTNRTYTIPAATPPGVYTATVQGTNSHLSASTAVTVGPTPTGPAPGPDDWANWGFDQQEHRVNPVDTGLTTSTVGQLGLAWQAKVPGPDEYQASPTVANGIVYAGTTHGLLSAYNATTGALLWTFQANGPIYASPTIVDGIAYFGAVNEPQESQSGNYAYALNAASGAVIWAVALPNGGEWAAPLVASGVAYFTMANKEASSGGLIALNALTGVKIWEVDTPYGIWAQPSLDPSGQFVYQGTGNPCLGPTVGVPCAGYMLKVPTAGPAAGPPTTLMQAANVSGDDDIATAPTYDNGNLYFASKDGIFYSEPATGGTPNWTFNTNQSGDLGIFSSAAVYNGLVIFGSMGTHMVYALNETTGAQVWAYDTGNEVAASPIVADGMVFVASYSRSFVALDPMTGNSAGSALWSTYLDRSSGGSAAVANGMVFQTTGDGFLNAYALGSQAPTFVSGSSLTEYAGMSMKMAITATGLPGPTIATTSNLDGLTLTATPGGAALLSGTPTTTGVFPVTFTATNASGQAVQKFTLTVLPDSPVFTGSLSDTVTVGQPFSAAVTATGNPAPTLSASAATLPPGVNFVDDKLGNGTLSGTPTSTGTFLIALSATNSAGSAPPTSFTLTVDPGPTPPVLTNDTPPAAAALGVPFTYTFTASGTPAPTFSVASGAVPTGLSLDPVSGILSGTPTAAGPFSFTVAATNGVGSPSVSPLINMTVTNTGAPIITSAATTSVTVGQALSFTATTAGSPTPSISESGALPNNVMFTDNGNGTASLSGTPLLGQEGTYPITITAQNGTLPNATQNFNLVVNGIPPTFTADTPPTSVAQNGSYNYTFQASGDPTPTYSVVGGGTPVPGLSLDPITGVLSGTATTAGSFTFEIQAGNRQGSPAVTPPITVAVGAPADIAVKITGPTGKVPHGTTMNFTVTVNNLGPNAANNITVSFALPSGTNFLSSSTGGSYASGFVTWSIPTMASLGHFNEKVAINASAAGSYTVTASAQATNPDPNPSNNTVTDTVVNT
jgi:uncharacterized repeat protein (TIGR01451 family)